MRNSDDSSQRRRSSLFLDALALRPTKDNFFTTDKQGDGEKGVERFNRLQSLVSTLSTGPVTSLPAFLPFCHPFLPPPLSLPLSSTLLFCQLERGDTHCLWYPARPMTGWVILMSHSDERERERGDTHCLWYARPMTGWTECACIHSLTCMSHNNV